MPLKKAPDEIVRVPEEVTGQPQRMVVGELMLRQTFSALRHRNFRLFFSGQLVSLIGTWMQNTAQGWLVYEITGSKWLLGLVTAVNCAPMLFFSILGGSIADQHSKRNIVLWTQTAMMVLAFTFAGLVWSGHITTGEILVIAALRGVAMAFDMPARQSFMVEMTSREDLMNAISLNSSMVNGARVIGPTVAGLLIAQIGIAMCFFLDGLSYLAVIAGLMMMRLPKFVKAERTGSAAAHAFEGFSYVWKHRRMKTLLILFAIVGVFGWSYSVLMPAFAADELKVGAGGYGALLTANGIGALFGALTVASVGHRLSRRFLVFGGLWIFSAMLLLLAFVHNFYLALVLLAIGGWGMLLFFSTTNTLLQLGASDEMRGRVMGVWALVFGGMMPFGGLEAGALSHYFGVRWTVATGAVVCALAALVTWLIVRMWGNEEGRMQNAE
ncbi:MAG TPA: MFS transporter [Verrucomicrobiae bacterium]|jgi:MFS family permease|nr:MFS transporter [Verrucomicrobiae bacterium]